MLAGAALELRRAEPLAHNGGPLGGHLVDAAPVGGHHREQQRLVIERELDVERVVPSGVKRRRALSQEGAQGVVSDTLRRGVVH